MIPMQAQHYGKLGVMLLLSFAAMYILMYAMVDVFGNVFLNVNQFYMAGLMTMPMVILEIALMGMMYTNKKANMLIVAASILALVFFWIGIRQQVAVGDVQFIQSMIPHHASAILMCNQASIRDPEIRDICFKQGGIIDSQTREIERMKVILDRLEK